MSSEEGNPENGKKKAQKKTDASAEGNSSKEKATKKGKKSDCTSYNGTVSTADVLHPELFLPSQHDSIIPDIYLSEMDQKTESGIRKMTEFLKIISFESGNPENGKKKAQKKTDASAEGNCSKEKASKKGKKSACTSNNGTVSNAIVIPPEGFLPYQYNTLTPEILEYAAKHLNETDETREKGIKEMREILKSNPDLVFMDDERLLLLFLRSRKFDAKVSADFFYLGLSYVESYRHLLVRQNPAILRRCTSANMMGFLPYRDQKGRAIIYSRADRWDPSEIEASDAIYSGVVAVQSAAHNQVNQIVGFVVILNLQGLKIQQVVAMTRWMIFGTLTLQRACPCFMKAFHCINVPTMYKAGWKLVKPLLSDKIRKRFIFHKSSDLSSLYEHVSREVLPLELGGNIPFSNDHWAQDLDNIEKEYYDHMSRNYYISKRKKSSS